MPSNEPDDIRDISRQTIAHYDAHAEAFWEGTRDHDVAQNYAALLDAIAQTRGVGKTFSILDFGCGPGRDLAYFASLGHTVVGVEGSERFVAMARTHARCEVLHQDFMQLTLPADRFDGIFANAALFHVVGRELPRVLGELRTALKTDGVLFASNPHGDDEEVWSAERYGFYYTLETWRSIVAAAGFRELSHYYRPAHRPRALQPWLATVWRKTG